jgi:DNA/RNA endonuclease G (NUC1)
MLELNREIWQCFEKNCRNLATKKIKNKKQLILAILKKN